MQITVLSGSIHDCDVIQALLSDGVVVLQTSRPDAEAIHEHMLEIQDIDAEFEESKSLLHLLLESKEGDWIPCLIYTGNTNEYERIKKLVLSASEQWIKTGSQDKFVVNIEF